MNKEQKQFKLLIKSDLRIVERNWDSDDKADRLQAAYHMQQAIEKTIKLKAKGEQISRCCKIHENFVDFGLDFCYTLFVSLCHLGGVKFFRECVDTSMWVIGTWKGR